ncbi:bifunctional (p)ppGpp synthetase/guanosine-3',5'-bis(diphosphate) 3'-pyrophosphohydrolase [Christensenellaceae bacterium NSJ-44]|uniref:GTP diphosphokinase n=1 Tax=Luoshenia tenuis TaxID=2763654 RepID=A0A926CYH3_9FIRM|nr:bifunctional (p)ppGpp synthetase/guanosine-3',5'-bis(diphosphate) 3'-pyrophosphohydrolase [Luoshenia tenuis]MBC8529045.1 bifunctional (p)ppGpp synthetase/guanosine-3',5'-bis(diphosphate) 3'-pyrophosphohydrolase [Luoshenia tenuis]
MDDFIARIEKIYPPEQVETLKQVYAFAQDAHKDQRRASGEPYIVHPLSVANILLDLGMDVDAISAGLLHDVIEDTQYEYEDIAQRFGNTVAMLVEGVSKLDKLNFHSRQVMQAENLRKMLLAMSKDIRIILIKLADRLHNMRTLGFKREEKQQQTANETLEIYAPLAGRLGIFRIKWELEDLCLFYLDHDAYEEISQKVAMKRQEREESVSRVIAEVEARVKQLGIHAEINGRPKHFYSIYKKMKNQNKPFDQIFDLTAIRVIVDTIQDCYTVLGTVHTLYKPIPGRFKDYIATPKPNMYQSLHSTLIDSHGVPFEIQIRTFEMHRAAEYGIAAHWKYKEGRSDSNDLDEKLAWLRRLLDWQKDMADASEFIDTFKIDLFNDEVFCFTPKGDVINLPKEATPLDFAYYIHSAVGNRCTGARVNGRIVPLDYAIKTGDVVEIITSASSHGPSRDWLKIAKTSQARSKIRQWFKKEFKDENIVHGRDMLDKEAKRLGYTLGQLERKEAVEAALQKFSLNSLEDMYAAVGFGGLTTNQVLTRLIAEYKQAHKEERIAAQVAAAEKEGQQSSQSGGAKQPQAERLKDSHGVIVKGEADMLVRFAQCCNPVPGDDIVGYITRGRGVSIHRTDCTNVASFYGEPERLVEVSWADSPKVSGYHAEVQIISADRPRLLADVTNAISDMKMQIVAINAHMSKNQTTMINITVEITDTEQLEKMLKQLRKIPEVLEAFRTSA